MMELVKETKFTREELEKKLSDLSKFILDSFDNGMAKEIQSETCEEFIRVGIKVLDDNFSEGPDWEKE